MDTKFTKDDWFISIILVLIIIIGLGVTWHLSVQTDNLSTQIELNDKIIELNYTVIDDGHTIIALNDDIIALNMALIDQNHQTIRYLSTVIANNDTFISMTATANMQESVIIIDAEHTPTPTQ